ncbi:MAG: hypothetical protein QM740_17180 [Acidovorax sp.]
MQTLAETPTEAPVPQTAGSAPEGKIFRMPLYRPGTRVRMAGRNETVSHIVVRRYFLSVHLVGREAPVRPDEIELASTVFSTARKPDPLLY